MFLQSVRIAYPRLVTPVASYVEGESSKKFSCMLLVPSNDQGNVSTLCNTYLDVLTQEKGSRAKAEQWFNSAINPQLAERNTNINIYASHLHSGEANPISTDFPNHWVIKATSSEASPPHIVNEEGELALGVNRNCIYSGCVVNVWLNIRPYALNNSFKGVTAYMEGVAFVGHGQAIGGGRMDPRSFLEMARKTMPLNDTNTNMMGGM